MTALVVRGDARRLPLPDASVDLIVTSPPYFALRSYTDAGEHYDGQIGSESTPAEYLDALWACTRDWIRVLKPEGSLWVNLGDKYAGGRSGSTGWSKPNTQTGERFGVSPEQDATLIDVPIADWGVPQKSLMGIPWRYALGCIDELGLILRAELVWSKPNGLPESVTDRVRRSHEQWFHLVKQPRYYAAVDEIREAHVDPTDTGRGWKRTRQGRIDGSDDNRRGVFNGHQSERILNPLGKLPGSVWSIPSEPLTVPAGLGVDHFAAFPTEWPRRLILGWSPPGICTACGQGRRPVVDRVTTGHNNHYSRSDGTRGSAHNAAPYRNAGQYWAFKMASGGDRITGYACACPDECTCSPLPVENSFDGPAEDCPQHGKPELRMPPARPAVVLDPFGGTGTTALVAHALGRVGITVDMSADYSRLARWRTSDRGELAKAMRVAKPAPVPDGQLTFEVTG